jgi:hypothetical protein
MSHTQSTVIQAVLPLACPPCPYKILGRCDGPIDNKTYLMQDKSIVGCLGAKRRGFYFGDTHEKFVPIPVSSHQDEITLPVFIPGIRDGLRVTWPQALPSLLFAVSLGKIINQSGNLAYESIDHLRQQFNLPKSARLALIGTSRDYKLEALWKISEREKIWERIAHLGFEFVTSSTYSVWDKHPRADQIRNQDRNFQTHDILANLGAPTIPFFFPVTENDYQAVFEWLQDRPDINKVAVLAQFYKSPHLFAQFLKNMRAIQRAAKRQLEFLVVEVGQKYKIEAIRHEFKASIVCSKPFQAALAGRRIKRNLEEEGPNLLLPRKELVIPNIEQYVRSSERVRRQRVSAA